VLFARIEQAGGPLAEVRLLLPVEASEALWPGEAKISGRSVAAGPVTEKADGDRFHAGIAEVVHTHLDEETTMFAVEWREPGHEAAASRPRPTAQAGVPQAGPRARIIW